MPGDLKTLPMRFMVDGDPARIGAGRPYGENPCPLNEFPLCPWPSAWTYRPAPDSTPARVQGRAKILSTGS